MTRRLEVTTNAVFRDWAAVTIAAGLVVKGPVLFGYEPEARAAIAKEAYALADALIAEATPRDEENENG